MFKVLIYLSIEGEGPREEIDPAYDRYYQLLPILHAGVKVNRFISVMSIIS